MIVGNQIPNPFFPIPVACNISLYLVERTKQNDQDCFVKAFLNTGLSKTFDQSCNIVVLTTLRCTSSPALATISSSYLAMAELWEASVLSNSTRFPASVMEWLRPWPRSMNKSVYIFGSRIDTYDKSLDEQSHQPMSLFHFDYPIDELLLSGPTQWVQSTKLVDLRVTIQMHFSKAPHTPLPSPKLVSTSPHYQISWILHPEFQ